VNVSALSRVLVCFRVSLRRTVVCCIGLAAVETREACVTFTKNPKNQLLNDFRSLRAIVSQSLSTFTCVVLRVLSTKL
jgi:hypothetical protein